MRFVVVTGPSGAGKTFALHSFEDAGFYTVDNVPPRLLPALIAFCRAEGRNEAAVVIDTRSGSAFAELPAVLEELEEACIPVETLFLDASDAVLVQRFKETRRPHPLLQPPSQLKNDPKSEVKTDFIRDSKNDGNNEVGREEGNNAGNKGGHESTERLSMLEAIQVERRLLSAARALAVRVVDTSTLTPNQLRDRIFADYAPTVRPGLLVTVISFGFKHGLPIDADLVFDVRFLRNPHYVPTLKALNGHDEAVARYVHDDPLTRPFQEKMTDLVRFALPQYEREGKSYLNIAIGCTGGRHRSVVVAEDLTAALRRDGFQVAVRHRDSALTEDGGAGTSYALPSSPASATAISTLSSAKQVTP